MSNTEVPFLFCPPDLTESLPNRIWKHIDGVLAQIEHSKAVFGIRPKGWFGALAQAKNVQREPP